ncbi:MAG: permease [Nisaea sp.]|nr:permease [Nisaea sp.]
MEILFDIVTPVFGLMAVGYLAAVSGLFPQSAARGLSAFVFNFAMPVMLFQTAGRAVLPDPFPWGFVLTYYGGVAGVWALAMALSGGFFKSGSSEAILAGMTCGFANTVMLGIPLVLTAFGEAGAVPLFIIISLHSILLIGSATMLIEIARGDTRNLIILPWSIGRGIVTNPIIAGLLLGLAANMVGFTTPAPVAKMADMLARAALPCAVFSMGASLAAYRLGGAIGRAGLWSVLKLAGHPTLVWLLGTYVFDLPALWRDVAVLVAALPVGINVYLLAARYQAGEAAVASSLVLSAGLSFLTVTVVLHLLNVTV